MFKITYRPKNDRDHSQVKCYNDIRDIRDFILAVTDNESEAQNAYKWCGSAIFGSKIVRQPLYKIECINEVSEQRHIKSIVEYICHKVGLTFKLGYTLFHYTLYKDGKSIGEIIYDYNFGYYINVDFTGLVISDITSVFSITLKDKNEFIEKSVAGINKILKYYKTKKAESSVWHKRYISGKNKKTGANDHIVCYYKDNGAEIHVNYLDWRHSKPVAYTCWDASGVLLGTRTKLSEAQYLVDVEDKNK